LNSYCWHQFYFVSRQTNLFIMLRIAAFAALVAVAVTLPAGPPAYGAPAPYAAPHHAPAHYDESPKPYAFQYGVADSYSGAQFNAQETADGKVVSGSYSVALPDGRIQTVTYTADHYNGYVADVSYSGEAVYPKYEPKPAYHAAPKYAPKPAYHA
jgi:hypothetical protein